MLVPASRSSTALLSSLLFSPLAFAYTLDCGAIQTEGVKWDLSKLGGPHSVMHSVQEEQPLRWVNTTFTVDICKALERPGSGEEKENFCQGGTRVCGIEHVINGETDLVEKVIPVAGEYHGKTGALDPQYERIKTSSSHSDADKEGVRVTMNGGEYNKRPQRAIIEFICNQNRTGEEGNLSAGHGKEGSVDDDKDEDGFCMPSLSFTSYGADPDDKMDILRLQWETKYACEERSDEDGMKPSWGFFTWFILIAFLGTATYLVFGSWLNYNRYGARGWDLIPHGDTIRDVPYLLKDWTRRAMNTVQGGGSRGGYSAV